jgi:hypothetical protein
MHSIPQTHRRHAVERLFVLSIPALLLLSTISLAASASTHCEVLTIKASNDGKGIDNKISKYSNIFKKEPFSRYDSFALLRTEKIQIELKSPRSLQLPDGIEGSLVLNNIADGKLDLTFALARGAKPPIRINGIAAPGSPIFAAGMKSGAGIWIFGVACDFADNGISY